MGMLTVQLIIHHYTFFLLMALLTFQSNNFSLQLSHCDHIQVLIKQKNTVMCVHLYGPGVFWQILNIWYLSAYPPCAIMHFRSDILVQDSHFQKKLNVQSMQSMKAFSTCKCQNSMFLDYIVYTEEKHNYILHICFGSRKKKKQSSSRKQLVVTAVFSCKCQKNCTCTWTKLMLIKGSAFLLSAYLRCFDVSYLVIT